MTAFRGQVLGHLVKRAAAIINDDAPPSAPPSGEQPVQGKLPIFGISMVFLTVMAFFLVLTLVSSTTHQAPHDVLTKYRLTMHWAPWLLRSQ